MAATPIGAAASAASSATNVKAGSQAGAYAALLFGGVLLVAAAKGDSLRNVLSGVASPIRPLTSAIPSTFEGAPSQSPAPGPGTKPNGKRRGAVQKAPKAIPQSHSAAAALHGVGSFEGQQVALWIIPYLTYAKAHGWTGTVSSGYRSIAEQTAIYNSGVRPAAVPGTSNHEGKAFPRGAVDVTQAEQLSHILEGIPGGSLLKWAGSADPVHFSFPHGGGY